MELDIGESRGGSGGDPEDDERRLVEAMAAFNIELRVLARHVGPRTITYRVMPSPGVTVSAIMRRALDVGVQLSTASCTAREEQGRLFVEVAREDMDIPRFADLPIPGDPDDLLVGVDGLGAPVHIRLDKLPHCILAGSTGCLHGDTPIHDPVDGTTKTVRERWALGVGFHVWALGFDGQPVVTAAMPPEQYRAHQMLRITLTNGEVITVTPAHRFWTNRGWMTAAAVSELHAGSERVLLPSTAGSGPPVRAEDALRWSRTTPGSLVDCRSDLRSGGARPLSGGDTSRAPTPSRDGAHGRTQSGSRVGGSQPSPGHNLACPGSAPHAKTDCLRLGFPSLDAQARGSRGPQTHGVDSSEEALQCHSGSCLSDTGLQPAASSPPSTGGSEEASNLGVGSSEPSRSSRRSALRSPRLTSPRRTSGAFPRSALDSQEATHSDDQSVESTRSGSMATSAPRPSRSYRRVSGPTTAVPPGSSPCDSFVDPSSNSLLLGNHPQQMYDETSVAIKEVQPINPEPYYDFHVPVFENYWAQSIWHHNSGKSTAIRVIARGALRSGSRRVIVCDPKGSGDFTEFSHGPHQVHPSLRETSSALWTMGEVLDLRTRRKRVLEVTEAARNFGNDDVLLVVDEVQLVESRGARDALHRILATGRSMGMNCIIATQHPSAVVLGAELRANCPSRLVFQVSSLSDSRVALGDAGAERLLGLGDGLLRYQGRVTRIQVPSID